MRAAALRGDPTARPDERNLEEARIYGALRRLTDVVGFDGALKSLERARADFVRDHGGEGWIG